MYEGKQNDITLLTERRTAKTHRTSELVDLLIRGHCHAPLPHTMAVKTEDNPSFPHGVLQGNPFPFPVALLEQD